MKILCPTNSAEEIEELIANGASEFYLGYVAESWGRKFSHIASSNRRYYPESSFHSLKEIAEVVKIAEKQKVPINLAINGSYYLESQYPELLSQVRTAEKIGINSIIVADIPLLLKIKQYFPKLGLIASTCTSAFNSSSVHFYASLGVKRLILPRHLTLPEIRKIRENVSIELEVVGLFDWCIYDDGMCTFHHGMENVLGVNHGCLFVNDYQLMDGNLVQKRIIDSRINNFHWDHFCAACLLPELQRIGIDCFKIAGRRFPTPAKIQALQFVKASLSENVGKDHEQLYFETFQRRHPLNANAYSGNEK